MTNAYENKTQFTTGEVANFCGVTLRTVINWIKSGKLDAYQLPGTRKDNRVTRDSLIAFMEQNGLPLPNELSEKKSSPVALIVDDDINMTKSIERILRQLRYETVLAADGFEAGLCFAKNTPTLMTLDLQMPRLDGFTVLEKLKEDNSCYICVISGMEQTQLEKAKNIRANAALQKPFETTDLVNIAEIAKQFVKTK